MTPRDTNNSADDEFGFNYMSEDEFNKRHKKALKKADSSYKGKKKKGWVKIADGVYQNLAKLRAEEKPKKKKKKAYTRNPIFKGLGNKK